jgi:hypothetical protein
MTINMGLYLLCAFGGIGAYSLFYGLIYAFFYKKIGVLRYRGTVSADREKAHGMISGAVLVAILIVYYFMRNDRGNMNYEMYLFVLLISFLTGRAIFPLFLSFFLPTGMYDNGIVTSRGLVFYDNVKRYDIHDSGKPRDADVLFLRIFPMKSEYFGGKVLIFDRRDKGKVQYIMKQRKVNS